MAIYLVEGPNGKTLVETRTKQGAINHVTAKEYTAIVVSTTELVQHIKAGLDIASIEQAPLKEVESSDDKVNVPSKIGKAPSNVNIAKKVDLKKAA